MKVVNGFSKIDAINEALRKEGRATIVCGKCSKLLVEDAKKIELTGGIVYCEEDAFAITQGISWKLKDEKQYGKFKVRLLVCRVKGWSNLYLYAPDPGSN